MFDPSHLALFALVGLLGGTLGGLLGLGGSVFIIPTLTLIVGPNAHLFQSAALIANVFVASAATLRHRGRGTIRADIVPSMLVSAAAGAVVGVITGNQFKPLWMTGVFGVFLCYAAISETWNLVARRPDHPSPPPDPGNRRVGVAIGSIGGFASGLLGIGGGAIMVPLLRKHARLPMREAVASSAAAMIAACTIAAATKFATIPTLEDQAGAPLRREDVLLLASVLSPAAMVGGSAGAALVYRIPIQFVRGTLVMLLAFAGVRMIAIGMKALA